MQGLLWYARKQKQDAHGDVADDFLEEGSPPTLLTPQRQVRNCGYAIHQAAVCTFAFWSLLAHQWEC
eukprot:486159-Pelagomonas_calceolata.AAC.2